MIQLVLTILAIVLFSAMLAATMNYAPWWYKTANEANEQFTVAFKTMESAYDLAVRANEGIAPQVTSDPDGGFTALYQPLIKFTPSLPRGFSIKYGINASEGSTWSGLNWFCVSADSTNEGVWRGLMRTKGIYSPDQLFVNTACGATSNMDLSSTTPQGPVAVTLYVAYIPGLN